MFAFRSSALVTLAVISACCITASGQAHQNTNANNNHRPGDSYTLNQATDKAISVHPEIKRISWQTEKTLSDGFQQSRLVNPQVGPLANEIGNEGQGGQYGFFLQRNLVRNNRVEEIQSAAQWEARSYEAQSELIQRRIAFETAKLFVEIEFIKRHKKLATQKLQELTRIKKIAASLMKGGEVAPIDLTRLELEIAKVRQSILDMEIQTSKSRSLLSLSLGTREDIELDFDLDQEVSLVLRSNEERVVDLDEHPSVRQISDQIEAQKWRYQVATSRQAPDWQLQTSVNYDTASDDFFGGFQLNIPWMVNDRKTGLIGSAAASVQILNESRNQTKRLLEKKLIMLSAERKLLKAKISNIDSELIPKTDDVSEKTIALFHAGETDHKSVKEAVMMGYEWREKRLKHAKNLLLVEIETETLTLAE